ncbi:STAS domain-containing protein [Candidatus Hydrogenedentota bacterium]
MDLMAVELDGVKVVHPVGSMKNENEIVELKGLFKGCKVAKQRNVIFNMEDVEDMSYTGIGVLVQGLRQARSMGGDVRLASLDNGLTKSFSCAGALPIFQSFETESEALRSFAPV